MDMQSSADGDGTRGYGEGERWGPGSGGDAGGWAGCGRKKRVERKVKMKEWKC